MIDADIGAFKILLCVCLLGLTVVGSLYIVKSEVAQIKFTDKNAICAKHDMRYTYARIDICIDKNGQMYSMKDLNEKH